MQIPRVIESELAEDTTTAWGTFWPKGAKVLLMSELKDKQHGDCLVGVPNPVPAYLGIVEDCLSAAKSIRGKMFGSKSQFPQKPGPSLFTNIKMEEFDEYFQVVTVLTIFSWIALEAWCNQMIPEDYIFKRRKPHRWLGFLTHETKLDKINIERWVSLDDKLLQILPDIRAVPHFKAENLWRRYKQLKKARDEFTHLKSPKALAQNRTNYDPLFQVILDLDLEDIAKVPKDVMTYFVPAGLGF